MNHFFPCKLSVTRKRTYLKNLKFLIFYPSKYRIVQMDQRGCAKSTPHAELKDNNTQALVADIEKLREFLGIETWYVFGGSWGSTLSLTYAIHHPDK